MTKYANQKTVKIIKPEKSENYAIYSKPGINLACKYLNGAAFKIWCYLLSNAHGITWDISPKHAEKEWGIPQSSFSDGLKELKKKGYYDENLKEVYMISKKSEKELIELKRKKS